VVRVALADPEVVATGVVDATFVVCRPIPGAEDLNLVAGQPTGLIQRLQQAVEELGGAGHNQDRESQDVPAAA
jgi:hypothetical protein